MYRSRVPRRIQADPPGCDQAFEKNLPSSLSCGFTDERSLASFGANFRAKKSWPAQWVLTVLHQTRDEARPMTRRHQIRSRQSNPNTRDSAQPPSRQIRTLDGAKVTVIDFYRFIMMLLLSSCIRIQHLGYSLWLRLLCADYERGNAEN